MKIDLRGPKTVRRVVNSLKNQYKWPELDIENTEWSSKYCILDQFSQSFTSRDKSSKYLM